MGETLIQNPVLVLFLVIALGYGLGRVRIGNFSFGVAAVLFVGLAFGALYPGIQVPDIMIYLGLSLFVYCIGLASGPSFFATIRSNGLRDVGFVIVMLAMTATLALGLHYLLGFDAQTTAGLYAGSTTNTPALAGLIDLIAQKETPAAARTLTQEAVSGYSLAYPLGIMGTLLAVVLVQRLFRVNYDEECDRLRDRYPVRQEIITVSVRVTNPQIADVPIRDLKKKYQLNVVFGRRIRADETVLTNWDSTLQPGDYVVLVGDRRDLDRAIGVLGEQAADDLLTDDSEYIVKRIFVSNPDIAGQKLSALNLDEQFSAIVTRIRRGDMDILASRDVVLELGDIVRFVTRRRDVEPLSVMFGDSYESLSRVNLFAFGAGLSIGLLLGMITFEIPGAFSLKLGFAVGPVLVALVLGALRRTGPVVWTLPYSANLTFQQFGLAIMLAGIGINSGDTFIATLGQGSGVSILLASLVISFVSAAITLIVGYKVVKMPFGILGGMVAHQPAILDFTVNQAGNKLPNLGFTLMLPIAIIMKILFVQLLYLFLQ